MDAHDTSVAPEAHLYGTAEAVTMTVESTRAKGVHPGGSNNDEMSDAEQSVREKLV